MKYNRAENTSNITVVLLDSTCNDEVKINILFTQAFYFPLTNLNMSN